MLAYGCGKVSAKGQEEFASPWLRSINVPKKSRAMIMSRVHKFEACHIEAAMQRAANYFPLIAKKSKRVKVDPWAMIGIGLLESGLDADAVDRMVGMQAGLFQESADKLPKWQRNNKKRIDYARKYSQTKDKSLISLWARYDMRFDPEWNAKAACYFAYRNMRLTGDSTFFVAAHNSGPGGPLNAICRQAARNGDSIHFQDVAGYVRDHKWNYFLLYEANGPAYNYWCSLPERHEFYVYNVAAWSEVFARWIKNHPEALANTYRSGLYPGKIKKHSAPGAKTKSKRACAKAKGIKRASALVEIQSQEEIKLRNTLVHAMAEWFRTFCHNSGHVFAKAIGYGIVWLILIVAVCGALYGTGYLLFTKKGHWMLWLAILHTVLLPEYLIFLQIRKKVNEFQRTRPRKVSLSKG